MKILVVDDSQTMRRIVIRSLKAAGFGQHAVVEAGDGAEGLEKVKSDKPDVIISDWNMPEMNGIEFLQSLREKGYQTRFGFITTEGTEDVKQLATESGATFFIEKPFTPEHLELTLGPILN